MLDVQKRTDIEVLASLGHHEFISRDDKHDHVDSAHAGQHVLNESFVARNVDEADGRIRIENKIGKSDIDCDSAVLLFLQAVGVDAGERLDERGLAVIDMSSRSYDNVRHNKSCTSGRGSPITLK